MLAPLSAIRPATAAIAAALSGAPITVTCERPSRRPWLSPVPRSIVDAHPEVARGRLDGVAQPLPVAGRGDQDAEDQAATEHDLLDVEDLDPGLGQGGEHRGGDAGPVLPRDGEEQGLRLLVAHGCFSCRFEATAPGRDVGGGPYCVAHESATPHLRLRRAGGARPRGRQAVLRRRVRLDVHRLRPRLHRHPAPRRRGRDGRPQPRPSGRRRGCRWSSSTATTSTPRSTRSSAPAARSPRSRSTSRAGAASTSPTRSATSWRSGPRPEVPHPRSRVAIR